MLQVKTYNARESSINIVKQFSDNLKGHKTLEKKRFFTSRGLKFK